jgi:hypothetical protein
MALKSLTIPLADKDVMAEWRAALEAAIAADDGKDARAFVGFYSDFLKDNPTFPGEYPEAAAFYDDLYAKAMWLALPYLGEKDGLAIFESRLTAAFKLPDFDLWEKTRQWLLNFLMEDRDDIRAKVFEAIRKSGAEATNTALKLGETSQAGTVGNWVNYYQNAMGPDLAPDPLKLSQFFYTDKAFNGATVEEREKLRQLFRLVDKIKLSSFDAPGFEEDIVVKDESGEMQDYYEGEELKLGAEAKEKLKLIRRAPTSEQEKARLAGLLRGAAEEVEEIAKMEEEIQAAAAGDEPKLRDAFYQELSPVPGKLPAPRQLVAYLKQLARAGVLDTLLSRDKRFFDLVVRAYTESGQTQKIDDLKVYPTSAAHLAVLLQILLRDFGKMDENASARFAVQLANIMAKQGKDKYLGQAYLDEDSEEFFWSEPFEFKAEEETEEAEAEEAITN